MPKQRQLPLPVLYLLATGKQGGGLAEAELRKQDERWLDYCDEQGILIWNEALAWGNYAKQLTDPTFMAAELATANAMLDTSFNHPSVILWGFFSKWGAGHHIIVAVAVPLTHRWLLCPWDLGTNRRRAVR